MNTNQETGSAVEFSPLNYYQVDTGVPCDNTVAKGSHCDEQIPTEESVNKRKKGCLISIKEIFGKRRGT